MGADLLTNDQQHCVGGEHTVLLHMSLSGRSAIEALFSPQQLNQLRVKTQKTLPLQQHLKDTSPCPSRNNSELKSKEKHRPQIFLRRYSFIITICGGQWIPEVTLWVELHFWVDKTVSQFIQMWMWIFMVLKRMKLSVLAAWPSFNATNRTFPLRTEQIPTFNGKSDAKRTEYIPTSKRKINFEFNYPMTFPLMPPSGKTSHFIPTTGGADLRIAKPSGSSEHCSRWLVSAAFNLVCIFFSRVRFPSPSCFLKKSYKSYKVCEHVCERCVLCLKLFFLSLH